MIKNNILNINHADCCGCKLCGDSCPRGAVRFKPDEEGFFYPSIDESKCVDCGICLSKCPADKQLFNSPSPSSYACFAKDPLTKKLGSSGGMFGLITKEILANKGKVWGAAFDDKLQLKHIYAVDDQGLERIYKSKYLQSDCSGIYDIIKQDIKNGILTLFCGTPCQCSALKNYVGNYESLILVDFICHGVPNQDLFNKNIDWLGRRHQGICVDFQFRYTGKKMKHPHSFSYVIRKGMRTKTFSGLHYQNPFYFGFQTHISLRPSCYGCKYAKLNRCTDITLGDFWGIEKYCSFNSKDGVSMILPNTQKGFKIVDEILKSGVVKFKEMPSILAVENNACLQAPTNMPSLRDSFFRALKNEEYDKVVEIYLTPKRKIIFDLYYSLPKILRVIVRKIMDKRMKYE